MSEKRVIKLPAAVKKQLEVALASGSTWEFTSLMQRIRNAARKAAPGDAGYIADPEAAILHAVKIRGAQITPLFYAISARSPGAVAAILERSPALAKSTATIRRPKVEVLSHHGVYVSSEKDAKRTGPLDFAKMVLAVDRELVQKTPKYPDIGETAYNDEYYYTLRGGEEVPVEVIEKEHRAYLQKLDRHVLDTGLIVRQITDVQAKATASAGKAKKAAPRLGV